MSEELIIRSAAIDIVRNAKCKYPTWPHIVEAKEQMIMAIEQAPTVPAEVVVHCRECKYYQDNNGGYPNSDCRWRQDETPDADDFCSCGERRESEDG